MDNVRKLKKLPQDLEPTSNQKFQIIKENIYVEEFPSSKKWEGLRISKLKRGTSLLLKIGKQRESYDL